MMKTYLFLTSLLLAPLPLLLAIISRRINA